MRNKDLIKLAEKYIEDNNITSNTYAIQKAFVDGAKINRDLLIAFKNAVNDSCDNPKYDIYDFVVDDFLDIKFNCLEQNIKGDSFRCESHCGKCVK